MAQSSPADLIALVRVAIYGSSTTFAGLGVKTLNAYVSGRVQPPALIDADAQTIDLPLIVVDPRDGGRTEYAGGYSSIPFQVYAYAKTQGEAWAIYDAAFQILQAARLWDPSGVITMAGACRQMGPPDIGFNDRTKAHFARGSWTAYLGG